MKKITRCALGLAIIFSSCTIEKEEILSREWSQPLTDDPLGIQIKYSIPYYEGMSEQECINKIKSLDYYNSDKVLFIDPVIMDGDYNDISVNSPNPDHMYFPHIINSMSNTWSYDYIDELNQLRDQYGAEGTQMFLDKYLEGDSTLGMKLKNF